MGDMQLDLAIVIVNYNVCSLLRRCLQTIYASQGDARLAVCVVDNQSTDDSVAMARAEFPQAQVIANQENVGYPAANNQGLRLFGFGDGAADPLPRYALLLNPDTELPPTTLAEAIAFMDSHPDVGVMGPRLLLPDGTLDKACRRGFPTPATSFYHIFGLSRLFPHSPRFARYNITYLDEHQTAEVDSVVGAFMLVRCQAIQQVGLMDEQFWMYGEDLDWAKRIRDAGWKVVYYPKIIAWHVKRASSRQNPRAQIEFYRAMLIFYYKHYRPDTPFWLHGLVLLGIALKGGRPIWRDMWAGGRILREA